MLEQIETKPVFGASIRPRDNQKVLYFFEPFKTWHSGVYDAEHDSVGGRSGFTSWSPEVTKWMDAEN